MVIGDVMALSRLLESERQWRRGIREGEGAMFQEEDGALGH